MSKLSEWERLTKSARESLSAKDWDNFCNVNLRLYEDKYEEGDKFAILTAIQFCGNAQIPLPEWLAQGFNEAMNQVSYLEAESLDDVFDYQRPKGKRLYDQRRYRDLKLPVYAAVLEAHKRGLPKSLVAGGAFDYVSKQPGINISAGTVSKLFYEINKLMKEVKKV